MRRGNVFLQNFADFYVCRSTITSSTALTESAHKSINSPKDEVDVADPVDANVKPDYSKDSNDVTDTVAPHQQLESLEDGIGVKYSNVSQQQLDSPKNSVVVTDITNFTEKLDCLERNSVIVVDQDSFHRQRDALTGSEQELDAVVPCEQFDNSENNVEVINSIPTPITVKEVQTEKVQFSDQKTVNVPIQLELSQPSSAFIINESLAALSSTSSVTDESSTAQSPPASVIDKSSAASSPAASVFDESLASQPLPEVSTFNESSASQLSPKVTCLITDEASKFAENSQLQS